MRSRADQELAARLSAEVTVERAEAARRRRLLRFRLVGMAFEGTVGLLLLRWLAEAGSREAALEQLRATLGSWDWVVMLAYPFLDPALSLTLVGITFFELTGATALALGVLIFAAWGYVLFGVVHFFAALLLDLD